MGTTAAGTSVANGASLWINQTLTIGDESLLLNGAGDGSGALRIGGGSLVSYAGAITLADNASIKVDAGSILDLTNPSGISGVNKALTFITDAGAVAELSGTLDLGAGNLTKTNAGALILDGSVLSIGSTSIAGGSLQVDSLSTAMHDITGDGALIVGDGSVASELWADYIALDLLSVAAGSTITINPILGGTLAGIMYPVPEPRPSSCCYWPLRRFWE